MSDPKDRHRAIAKTVAIAAHYKDWEYAAQQYRAGTRSVYAIADEIGVTKEELFDFFNKEHVHKDLTGAITDRTNSMLAHAASPQNAVLPVTDEDIISINATLQASMILQHRQDVGRARRVVLLILTELEFTVDNQDVLEDLGTLMRSEDRNGKDSLNDAYHRVIGMSGRVESIKKLSEALKICIMLERQAFGIKDDYEDPAVRAARAAPRNALDNSDDSFAKLQQKFHVIEQQHSKLGATDAVIKSAPAP